MAFNLDDYEPVEERLAKFWADHPDGRVDTELATSPDQLAEFVVRATIYRDAAKAVPWATGWAHEVVGDGHVNKTSALENCETSAIGRALANAGYAAKGRASREEMEKVQRGPTSAPPNPQAAAIAQLLAIAGGDRDRAAELWETTLAATGMTNADVAENMANAELFIAQAREDTDEKDGGDDGPGARSG